MGDGSSGIGMSILTLDASTPVPLSIQYVTEPGQKITMMTRMTWRNTQGIAPQ
jgi:hypothetical protein